MKIRIDLSAYVRLSYSMVTVVPDDTTKEKLEDLVWETYDKTDGGEFEDDGTYWMRGDCSYEVLEENPAEQENLKENEDV